MDVVAASLLDLDHQFARDLPELAVERPPQPVPAPALVVLNDELALSLGLDPEVLRRDGAGVFAGNAVPDGARPVAQAYAGHQFGGYSPRLGDGRALLLGELVDASGVRRDIHLKGSGRTPFARGGDGRAALGPMLREYIMGEAMHALDIPTTRALAVATTGDTIVREVRGRAAEVPGAVLTRIAASHLRVGTFQFAAASGDADLLRRLVDHAIVRHAPAAADADVPALALFDHVIEVQADLIARWMLVGFIHGVMNTDNMTISGETIDYGPCAFMEAYDPATVFSSIDHGGRYAFGNQPAIATWNLARLGETLLPLIHADADTAVATATERLSRFPDLVQHAWSAGMCAKLAMAPSADGASELIGDLLTLMSEQHADYTATMRSLSAVVRGDDAAARSRFDDPAPFDAWVARWLPLVQPDSADQMDRRNPVVVPRNHLVEAALDAATAGDLDPFTALVDAVRRPFDVRPGDERYAEPAPTEFTAGYRTFCGT
jgi:uncharacterized protein YdiU (UPF0061 family)